MRALQAFLLLLGAFAALTLGAAPAAASTATPTCHEAAAGHGAPARSPADAADKALKAMGCCVACVSAPDIAAPDRAAPVAPRPVHRLLPGDLPHGEDPSPEPGPPRLRLL